MLPVGSVDLLSGTLRLQAMIEVFLCAMIVMIMAIYYVIRGFK
jgi:hypothetical protein